MYALCIFRSTPRDNTVDSITLCGGRRIAEYFSFAIDMLCFRGLEALVISVALMFGQYKGMCKTNKVGSKCYYMA